VNVARCRVVLLASTYDTEETHRYVRTRHRRGDHAH
jgi:hypothetical protein